MGLSVAGADKTRYLTGRGPACVRFWWAQPGLACRLSAHPSSFLPIPSSCQSSFSSASLRTLFITLPGHVNLRVPQYRSFPKRHRTFCGPRTLFHPRSYFYPQRTVRRLPTTHHAFTSSSCVGTHNLASVPSQHRIYANRGSISYTCTCFGLIAGANSRRTPAVHGKHTRIVKRAKCMRAFKL